MINFLDPTFLYKFKEDYEFQKALKHDEKFNFGRFILNYDIIESSRSQNFQDLWVLYELGFDYTGENEWFDKDDLFCVEFGAADGLRDSNTYLLETYCEFTTILAEPCKSWHSALERNRPDSTIFHQAVSGRSNDLVNFTETANPVLSTETRLVGADYNREARLSGSMTTYDVETISLYDMLVDGDAPLDISYVSMDTEGSELEILTSFFEENDSFNIELFTVEHNFQEPNRSMILDLMKRNGYERVFTEISRWDDFYRKAIDV